MGAHHLDQVVGQLFSGFVAPEDQDQLGTFIQRVCGGEKSSLEYSLLRLDGARRIVETRAVPLPRQREGTVSALGVTEDVTDRRSLECALRESEGRFTLLADSGTAAVFILQGTQLRYVNRIMEGLTGHSSDELLSGELGSIVHNESLAEVQNRELARQNGQTVESTYEIKIRAKGDQIVQLKLHATLIEFEGSPAVLAVAAEAEHATERQQLVEALGQAKARQESLSAQLLAQRETIETTLREAESRVQTSAEAGMAERAKLETSLREAEARYREASEQRVADRGALDAARREAETRQQALAAEHAAERQQLVEALRQAKARQESLSAQLLAQRETLETTLREAESRVQTSAEAGMAERAQLQTSLRDAEARYREASDQRVADREALEAARRDAETRQQALAVEHAAERQQLMEALGEAKARQDLLSAQLLAQRETLEEALREAESRYRLLSEQSAAQQAALRTTLGEVETRCHVLSDERDRMRKTLAESERGYRSWAQAAPYGVIYCDAEGQFVDLNPTLVALLGYSSAQDLIGPDRGIDLCVDPGAWRRLVEQCRQTEHFEGAGCVPSLVEKRRGGRLLPTG